MITDLVMSGRSGWTRCTRTTWGGGLIFDALGSYDRAWQLGVLIGFGAGIVQIVAGGPTRDREKHPGEMILIPSAR